MKKILIAEDSGLMVSIIKSFITKRYSNIKFITAQNGSDAISMYNHEKPDMVFMDINMPIKDGLTASKEIISADPKAKIIIITSKNGKEKNKAEDIGVAGFLEKPFSSEQIQKCLKEALSY